MQVHVGPTPSGGAKLWIAYARSVLAQATTGQLPGNPVVPNDVLGRFEHFLDEWTRVADKAPDFHWSADIDPEEIEFLAHLFLNLVQGLADEAERRGFPLAPSESDEFYRALVTGFLDALAQAGGSHMAFAHDLQESWPGFKPEV
jgi:hypothetical protein